MSGFALTTKEMRCLACRERIQEEFRVGICSFCYEEKERKKIQNHNNRLMRYQEIDFFNHFEEQIPEHSVLMVWLSYTTQAGTIQMWHGILQTKRNERHQLTQTPFEIFEKQAHIAIRDYKEVYEVICCKLSY
ncbi:MAG: hypothetical protein MUE81_17540 [Thermoflexibacter sp.]|jgi:hypothetical protein|nr:hypothetical protein [Thermoflexibacter sp.]